jgi:hypothetical protein
MEELAMLVVIGTDCIGSHKSNYNTITNTTAPHIPSSMCGPNTYGEPRLYENREPDLIRKGLSSQGDKNKQYTKGKKEKYCIPQL